MIICGLFIEYWLFYDYSPEYDYFMSICDREEEEEEEEKESR